MQTNKVTTPAGRRPMTFALVQRQLETAESRSDKSVQKWKVFRDVCEARDVLGIGDRALAILDALLTFYPHNEIAEKNGLVVFPSNAHLSARAHGITGTTLRRHLAALIESGLIIRKDSPNGKRYARKDPAGQIERAFGFSLAPLVSRADELADMARAVAADRKRFRAMKEEFSIVRRDFRKLVRVAIDEDVNGDWDVFESRYGDLINQVPRTPSLNDLETVLFAMNELCQEVINILEMHSNSQKEDANDSLFERHIQNSNTDCADESEPCAENKEERPARTGRGQLAQLRLSVPLATVLNACPDVVDYAPGASICSWRDLMSAAVVVRSMLGVSPAAYKSACEVMGSENAAIAVACILQRAAMINCAGGYLRDLTEKCRRGAFTVGPMLMALARARQNTKGGAPQ